MPLAQTEPITAAAPSKRPVENAELPEAKRSRTEDKESTNNDSPPPGTAAATATERAPSVQTAEGHGADQEHKKPDFREAAANVMTALRVLASATIEHAQHVASDASEQIIAATKKGGEISSAALHKSAEVTGHAVGAVAQGASATTDRLRTVSSQVFEKTREALPDATNVKETATNTLTAAKEQLQHATDVASGHLKAIGSVAIEKAADLGDLLLEDDKAKAKEESSSGQKQKEKAEMEYEGL